MANLTMADLLAKESGKTLLLSRGQELTGEIISFSPKEIILDLSSKSEGVLPAKDLTKEDFEKLKVGDKLQVFVVQPENESGQAVLTLNKITGKDSSITAKWDSFQSAMKLKQTLTGKGLEVNKGGLVVELAGVRGFLPASQVPLAQAANLEELIDKQIQVTVIEVDPSQNRLILSQKTQVSEDIKTNLGKLKIGDKATGKVAAILPFGIFVTLASGIEGLVHISEVAWEKIEDLSKIFKVSDEVEAIIISVDPNTSRVNLSMKQLQEDPFLEISKKYSEDDLVKGVVSKINSAGVFISLENGVEGLIAQSKLDPTLDYQVGQEVTTLVASIDMAKRRISLTPFVTTTKGLIYK